MSAQNGNGISMSIAHSQQNVRLLELPPALLELLSNPNPGTLELKSADPTTSSTANAVLCTPTQTFNLRQVQTSNSVLITQPYAPPSDPSSTHSPDPGLISLSSCTSTLEALPQPSSLSASISLVRPHLLTYTGPDSIPQVPPTNIPASQTKPTIFSSIPLSTTEITQAWRHLCAFETPDQRCWIPTPTAALECWKATLNAMVARGWDMRTTCGSWDEGQSARVGSLVGEVESEGWPTGLVKAVCGRVGEWGVSDTGNGELDRVRIERERLVEWVGEMVLRSRSEGREEGIGGDELMKLWREGVPEPWVKRVGMDAIKGKYAEVELGMVRWSEDVESGQDRSVKAAAGKPGNRKWHEKFKQARK
ncbi:MAG: hypothetical protein M1820_000964 [Bogoriella megaspora]|nr:MAG: hypothetical protein M1820_000964 [Bogoriella megaspora]